MNVDPITDVESFSVEGDIEPVDEICNEKRYQLFWELVWPVVIGGTSDAYREPMRCMMPESD